ncbi:MAG TPA: NADH-quinone oxidoreductase subunit L [Opitutaceae bacterium]|jgi:NADH-quinone oxidoreductase subunit L
MTPLDSVLLVFLAPLGSAVVITLLLARKGGAAAALSVAASAVVAVGALALAFGGSRFAGVSWEWLRFGSFAISIGIKYDDLAALMLSIVGVVGLCVHVFSLGYMHDDAGKGRYFGGLSIFMFSMIGIVLADNLFMMFIFWELVGFSSYFLINHWREKTSAADASKKAFIVNRVGDFGFILGIILCYWVYGTVSLSALDALGHPHAMYVRAIPLLLFCGAVAKSAQLPLQVWLPDAMEGPTPVSALIHAATMVAAGIYMLCRIQVLMVPPAQVVIAWIGTLTALYAALCAIVQPDIKKVLAYSTLSQLGYMVAAFGLGSVGAAMFHLTTHAFFKALLFLGAGSVILGCHHEQDIFRMGGLRRRMPLTFWTFTVAVAAIIGLPGLAGFFSKDAILVLAFGANKAVFTILALTAILTAFYMVRLWKIVFLGPARTQEASHAHEAGPSVTAPLVLLAALSVVGGYWRAYPRAFGGVFSLIPEAEGSTHTVVLVTSLLVLVAGAGSALAFYRTDGKDALALRLPGVFVGLVALKESFDRAYAWYVEKVQQRLAMALNFIDIVGISGVLVRGLAGVPENFGYWIRALHTGRLSHYVYWFLGGVAVLWAYAAGLL